MQLKSERFEMRLDLDTIERLDEWRKRQADLPSRAEAVRRLMEFGLSVPVKFSDGEKLTMLMLCEIFKTLKIEGGIETSFVEAALFGGHYWGLEHEYPGIFHGHEDSQETVSEVADILEVWWIIELSYARLSKKDRMRVEEEAEPYGKHVEFRGFDGNNESEHMSVARFMLEKQNRFSELKGRNLNSHMPSVEMYRRMLPVFEPMRRNLGPGGYLSAGQMIALLNAQRCEGK